MYCEKLFVVLNRRLSEKKSIDFIAKDLCPGISKGREKVVKMIKMYKGGQYLLDNHEWLGYHIDRIRNPTGKTSYKVKPKKSEMLFKPSLSTRKPSNGEYRKWVDSLMGMTNVLTGLYEEIRNTTEGRYLWKVNELKKRTTELCSLLKAGIIDIDNNIASCKCPEEKPRYNKAGLHRKIFEKAKDQINIAGRVNVSKIAEDLKIDVSVANDHIKKMGLELAFLTKTWQEKVDKSTIRKEVAKGVKK